MKKLQLIFLLIASTTHVASDYIVIINLLKTVSTTITQTITHQYSTY